MLNIRIFKHLYVWVLIAIVIGGFIGYINPALGESLKPLGDGFIALIKMLIGPIIFCTVTLGIAGAGDMKKVGRIGVKSLIYFEVISTFALIIGLLVAHLIKPGHGFNADPKSFDISATAQLAQSATHLSTVDFIMQIIPKTFLDAFTASGSLLQVLLLSVLFGWAMNRIGDQGLPMLKVIENFSAVLFSMINGIMKLAPIGAGGAMAFTIGKYGIQSLVPLASLMLSFYITCLLFVILILGGITKALGFSIFKFLRYIREEILLVLGTSSSESALAPLMEKLERLGCPKTVIGLVVPSGYSFNLDGTNIYMTLSALFIAQAFGIDLTMTQQLSILGVAMITSKGAAGVTGSGFITLAATLSIVPEIPIEGLALILGVDRFMSEARAITNMIGNGVATLVVSRWERELDSTQLNNELNGISG